MKFLDVAAGIGQGIPTAIQNVHNISSIQNEQERLDLTRKAQEDAKIYQDKQLANEDVRLGIAQRGAEIQEKQFGLAEQEALQKKDIYDRARKEYEAKRVPNIDVNQYVQAKASGPRSQEHLSKVISFLDPEAAKNGKMSRDTIDRLGAYMKEQGNPEFLEAVLKDHRSEQFKLKKQILDLEDFDKLEGDLEKTKQDLLKANPTLTKQQINEQAPKVVAAKKSEALKELTRLKDELSAKEEGLLTKYKDIRDAKIAMQKSMDTEVELYAGVYGPAQGLLQMRADKENLARIQHAGNATGKLPAEYIKASFSNIDSKYAGVARSIYNTELAKLKALSDSQRESLIKSNSMAGEIWRIHKSNPEKQQTALNDQAFIEMVLPTQHKQLRQQERNNILGLIRQYDIVSDGGIPVAPAAAQGTASAAAPGTGLLPFNKEIFTKNWEKVLKANPDMLEQKAAEGIVKRLATKEEKLAFAEVAGKVEKSLPKSKKEEAKPKDTSPIPTPTVPDKTISPYTGKRIAPTFEEDRKVLTDKIKSVSNSAREASRKARIYQLKKIGVPEAEITKTILKEYPEIAIP